MLNTFKTTLYFSIILLFSQTYCYCFDQKIEDLIGDKDELTYEENEEYCFEFHDGKKPYCFDEWTSADFGTKGYVHRFDQSLLIGKKIKKAILEIRSHGMQDGCGNYETKVFIDEYEIPNAFDNLCVPNELETVYFDINSDMFDAFVDGQVKITIQSVGTADAYRIDYSNLLLTFGYDFDSPKCSATLFTYEDTNDNCNPQILLTNSNPIPYSTFMPEFNIPYGPTEICIAARTIVDGEIGCIDCQNTSDPKLLTACNNPQNQGNESIVFIIENTNNHEQIILGQSTDCNESNQIVEVCGPFEWCSKIESGRYKLIPKHIGVGTGSQSVGLKSISINYNSCETCNIDSIPDLDNDGVIDFWDLCPHSPSNIYVDKHGCDINSDNKNGLEEIIHSLQQISSRVVQSGVKP